MGQDQHSENPTGVIETPETAIDSSSEQAPNADGDPAGRMTDDDLSVTLSPGQDFELKTPDIRRIKEAGAQYVALGLIGITGLIVVAAFGVLFVTLLKIEAQQPAAAYVEATTGVLEALQGLLSTVFSPLLAFIFGYYFSEKQRAS